MEAERTIIYILFYFYFNLRIRLLFFRIL
jgi:hypothetical protein